MLLPGLGDTPLVDWDENIYAEASRQMVERDNYLNIYINDYPIRGKASFLFLGAGGLLSSLGNQRVCSSFPIRFGWSGDGDLLL